MTQRLRDLCQFALGLTVAFFVLAFALGIAGYLVGGALSLVAGFSLSTWATMKLDVEEDRRLEERE